MTSTRRTAVITGVIFIIATVAALLAAAADPILASPDFLAQAAAQAGPLVVDALLYLVAAFTSVGIAVALYPVMKDRNPGLALGSVVFRTIEAVFYLVAVVCLLSLVILSRQFAMAGEPDRAWLQALGEVLLSLRNHATLVGVVAFNLGALLYYILFFQSQILPRWLSVWGILGIALMSVACGLAWFSGNLITGYVPLVLPIALQEMVLAVWLLVKGFAPPAEGPGLRSE